MRIISKSKISDLHLRTILGNFFYLECPDLLRQYNFEDMPRGTTGEIVYGYIDSQAGLSFQACCYATRQGDDVTTTSERQQNVLILRYGFIKDYEVAQVDYDFAKDELGSSFKKSIHEDYTPDKMTMTLRQLEFLDPFRNDEFPDDLKVRIFREGLLPEDVWVRPNTIKDNKIFGELLNQPYEDYGVNLGAQIQIIPYKMEDGELICISIFE